MLMLMARLTGAEHAAIRAAAPTAPFPADLPPAEEIASRLVRTFGSRTLDVIDREPAKLREVEGIGPVRAEQIAPEQFLAAANALAGKMKTPAPDEDVEP